MDFNSILEKHTHTHTHTHTKDIALISLISQGFIQRLELFRIELH